MSSAGIFYSLMVLSLLAPIILYITSYMDAVKTQGEQMTVKFEGIELANYADSIALDVPRVLDIASKRAIVAVIDYADTNGQGVTDAEYELKHLILHNNYSDGSDAPIMLNSSFSNWIQATEIIGSNHGFVSDISVGNLTITYVNPFTLDFSIDLYANITDRIGTMRLSRIYTSSTIISIEGFTDPVYPIYTRGLIERGITKANMSINDSISTRYMINNSWYRNNTDAPSFLERMQGCLWPLDGLNNCTNRYPKMGIESFVFFPEMRAHFEETDPLLRPNSTMIDHYYFNLTQVEGYNVTGITVDPAIYDWFKMDEEHNDTYGVLICGTCMGCNPC